MKIDVRDVYITSEVAKILNLSSAYTVILAKKIGLEPSEMRQAGTRNYLFSKTAIEKIRNARQEEK